MATLSHSGTRRKITVNERVERILHGVLESEEAAAQRTPSAAGRDEAAMRRSRQLSQLYTSSLEDKFVRARVHANAQDSGAKSVPKNARLGQRKVLEVPPIGSVKCYARHMLEQIAQQDEHERAQFEATQFPPPDFSPPKPWYAGYSPLRKAPSGTVDAKVRRYGAYGTAKMVASVTVSATAPTFLLHTSQSLTELVPNTSPDAWAPTLDGSPSRWPEDTNYPSGCGLAPPRMTRCELPTFRFPTHVVGATQPPTNDRHYERMQQAVAQDSRVLAAALADEKQRRAEEIAYNRDKLKHWQEQLHFEPLSSKMDHAFVKVPAVRAREVTILHTSEYSPLAKHDDHVRRLQRERFPLRWRSLGELLDGMKKTPCRRPVLQDIDKLLALAYELSLQNLNHLELSRSQCVDLFQREYPSIATAVVNRVFSSYDWRLGDRIDMRLLLATVRALRVQQGMALEMLTLAWHDFDLTRQHVVGKAAHFVAVLAMCSGSEEEEQEMQALASVQWKRMAKAFEEETEARRQRRLRGEESSDDAEPNDPSLLDAVDDDEDDDRSSTIDSLVFLGSGEVERGVPIKFARRYLRQEKLLLQRFTDTLVRRREECAAIPSPTKGSTS